MRAVLLVACLFAVGCGASKPTEDWSGAKPTPKAEEKPAPKEPPPKPAGPIKPVGQLTLNKILVEYHDPGANPNRAALADKYHGKYFEFVPSEHDTVSIEEDCLYVSVMFAERSGMSFYFRDKKDLLKFGHKGAKFTGPKSFVGKVVSDSKVVDCFIP